MLLLFLTGTSTGVTPVTSGIIQRVGQTYGVKQPTIHGIRPYRGTEA